VLCCALLSHGPFAEVGDVETVQRLLQAEGVNVNAQLPHSHSTPLHLACKAGHADVAKLLVDAGADVNAATGAPCTARQLVSALKHGLLIEPGS
jgi:ankyrin repeat protein